MNGMRFQPVNFAGRRVPRWYGWAAILVALLLAGDAGYTYMRGKQATAALNEERATVLRPAPALAPAEQRRRQLVFEDAQKLALRLATPWDALFNAIERSGGNGVQVQAIKPNSGSRQIIIAAEATELTAMLNFLTRLGTESVLSKPYIQTQELRPGSSFPLQFVVAAEWRQEVAK